MSGHEVPITVDDLAPVVDRAAETRALTHVEHGGPQTLHVLLEVSIHGCVFFMIVGIDVVVVVVVVVADVVFVVVGVHRGKAGKGS